MPSFFDGLTFIVVLGIFGGMGKFAYEFTRDATRRRSDLYDKLREKFESDEFDTICKLLDDYKYGSPEERSEAEKAIHDVPLRLKEKFAAFIEHIGLITKSGVLTYRLANYEFGHYTILCWECPPFWDDITDPETKQNDPYWALYREFVEKLRPTANALKSHPSAEIAKLKI